jgi:hypothetical protein
MPQHLSTFDIRGRLTLTGAAGTSGQVLTSGGSGTTPTWTTPNLPMQAGYWYGFPGVSTTTNTALTLNQLYFLPIFVNTTTTVFRIGTIIGAAATPGGVVRLGLYNATSTGRPNNRLEESGTIASTSTGGVQYDFPSSRVLTPGLYFLAVVSQVAACNITRTPTQTSTPLTPWGPSNAVPTANPHQFFIQTGVTGALPATITSPSTSVLSHIAFIGT